MLLGYLDLLGPLLLDLRVDAHLLSLYREVIRGAAAVTVEELGESPRLANRRRRPQEGILHRGGLLP